jgi:hypothetical protein
MPAKKKAVKRSAASPRKPVVRTVAKAVGTKARQGLEVAHEGLKRLKATTSHLVEEVKEKLAD